MNSLDKKYTNLLNELLIYGVVKKDRTGTGTLSVFGREIRHNMSEGFPLLTTKKMAWKSMVIELIWFLRGDTNIKFLIENGCNIWNGDCYKNYVNEFNKGNASGLSTLGNRLNDEPKDMIIPKEDFIDMIKNSEEYGCEEFAIKWGDLGPIYGKQWRDWSTYENASGNIYFGGRDTDHIDQINNLINQLKTNPDSRRLVVTAWNPSDIPKMTLPPCHMGFQCYTREIPYKDRYDMWFNLNYESGMEVNYSIIPDFDNAYYIPTPSRYISLQWNQRSVDTFLGLPFNIASYGLLLEILAKEVSMIPDELIGTLGDTHLYSNHIEQAKIQISNQYAYENDVPRSNRGGFNLPTIKIEESKSIDDYTFEDFELIGYKSHGKIKAPLSN